MPIMNVHLLEGRTDEQKARLIEALTEAAMNAIDAPRESIRVLLIEIPKTDFGIGGRTAQALGR
ncbi:MULTISPECIES: 2-hydroxymuconate tautomerase [Paraburkholderia]|uniref:Tautomerase n=1 Tax=Paraburkholderia piptadeniae TaxID=1701573 RepID=A0A1N7SGF2_9BURK|nr:2-hydroxymuconate tautomerase [Paraburkholderia piptadeniae]SIT46473.1 2-hydroxymuconate tautomerase [Paraburkholderia piptadeniae]